MNSIFVFSFTLLFCSRIPARLYSSGPMLAEANTDSTSPEQLLEHGSQLKNFSLPSLFIAPSSKSFNVMCFLLVVSYRSHFSIDKIWFLIILPESQKDSDY